MAACMQNMMLQATKLGIGSCWVGTYPDPLRMNPIVELLQIPSNIEPFCGLVLGYPLKEDAFKEVKREAKIHINKYNA
jgi:nitroreductase